MEYKPLYEDQIHAPAFQRICDYFYSDDVSREKKSGVNDYAVQCARDYDMKLVDYTCMPESGVIFVGMCHILEDIFRKIPKTGNYIFVHRTNDRPFTKEMYEVRPESVKHIYTVDNQVTGPFVTAIPFGNASINGEDEIVKMVAKEKVKPAETKVFARYNVNASTVHRNESILHLTDKPFVKLIRNQIPGDEFYREVKAHKYTMALAGCGADASRQWAAIQLGSIPIVTDCPEMRHFEDLPMIFCPHNFKDLTEEWLDAQDVTGKNTDRMRMSYWEKHIENKKKEHGI